MPGLETTLLNQGCKPYSEQFSENNKSDCVKKSTFLATPGGKRKVEKCNRNSPWKQDGSRCPVIDYGEASEVIANVGQLSVQEREFCSTPQGIVQLNKKGISLAVERRIALFFQQAILCYKMSAFTFSVGGADGQIGSSPKLDLKGRIHKREAAHSSTIPSLIAHAKDGSTPNGIIYLKGGGSYEQHNATIGMHECVNGADELIDGNGKGDKLRATAIKILNRVAQGLDPVKATEQFIAVFENQVCSTSEKLKTNEKKGVVDTRRLVLEAYRDKIGKKKLAAQEKNFYDMLIGVIIHSNSPNEAILRREIYQKRYDIIQLQEIVESRIGERIAAAQAKMGVREKGFLEYLLLKEFAQAKDLQILEKLFCKTAAVFEDEYQKGSDFSVNQRRQLKTFKTKVDHLRTKYGALLQNLARDLRSDFRELTCAEYTYKSGVFKVLRVKVNEWRQVDFCEKHLEITGQKVSASWVSRMEQLSRPSVRMEDTYKTHLSQRRRYVTLQDALDCARTFGVDNGVFLPSLFTS